MHVARRTPAKTERHSAERQSAERADLPADTIDLDGVVFARRLASLMVYRRKEMRRSVRAMARRSGGRFTRRDLQRFEDMELALDAVLTSALADLYRIDLDTLLPLRGEVEVGGWCEVDAGEVGEVHAASDASGLLATYLRLVRRLRGQLSDEVVELRRADIERLSAFLDEPGEAIVVRLGALMGATRIERREMAGTFLSGAPVVSVVGR